MECNYLKRKKITFFYLYPVGMQKQNYRHYEFEACDE